MPFSRRIRFEQHLGRAGLAEPAGELLTVIGQDLLRHPVAPQRRRQPLAHRPAGPSHHDLHAHAIARVVIDPGQHLDLGAVGKRDLHQVQLPQLHRACTFPPPVRPLAASAPRGDQPVAHQQPPDRRAAGQWHDPSPLQLVPKPLRPPPGMLAAQLAHPGLDRCGQLVRAPVGPMGAVGQPLQPTSPVSGDPGVDRLAADPVAVGDLGHRQPRFQHLQHRVVALLGHAPLPQHLSASCPRRRTPHTSKPSGGVKHQPKHPSSISRSRPVKHHPQQHTVLVRFVVRSFSTNSRPALRAAACGGRPRPAATRPSPWDGPHPPRRREPAQGIAVLDVGRGASGRAVLGCVRRAGWR